MPRIIHPVAGLIALLTIATFWISAAVTELFASDAAVAAVKTAVPWGFILLIPALAITGGSGFALAKGARAKGWSASGTSSHLGRQQLEQ